MDTFSHDNYKDILKVRLKELKTRKRFLTFRRVADHLNLQATYLSKVLNNEAHHLSEDDLYSACKLLEFLGEETEYILFAAQFFCLPKADRKKN